MSSVFYQQTEKLAWHAAQRGMPHGVEVEGTISGVGVSRGDFGSHLFGRRLSRSPLPVGIFFCHIDDISIGGNPVGDGKLVQEGCRVDVSGGERIASQLSKRGFKGDGAFNLRARFYANGTLNVELLGIEEEVAASA